MDDDRYPKSHPGEPEARFEVSEDEVWNFASEVDDEMGAGEPFLTVVERLFPDVCPTALLDPEMVSWVNRETLVNTYHQLLYPGSMLEQPNRAVEALQTVRSAKDDFQLRKIKKPEGK